MTCVDGSGGIISSSLLKRFSWGSLSLLVSLSIWLGVRDCETRRPGFQVVGRSPDIVTPGVGC